MKAIKKSCDRRLKELVCKAFDAAPPISSPRIILGDLFRAIKLDGSRGWSDKKVIEKLNLVRLNPGISGECADYVNQALEIMKS